MSPFLIDPPSGFGGAAGGTALTLSQLKQGLKRYGFDDSDPLDLWINAALREFENASTWPFLETKAPLMTLAAGDNSVPVPSDFAKVITLRDTNPTSPNAQTYFEYWDRRRFDRDIPNPALTGKPYVYTLINLNEIQVWPVPDTELTLELVYYRTVLDLVQSDDVPAIPERWHYTIIRGAAYLALQAENEEERAQTAMAQFNQDIDRAVTYYANRELGEPDQVEDVMNYMGGGAMWP